MTGVTAISSFTKPFHNDNCLHWLLVKRYCPFPELGAQTCDCGPGEVLRRVFRSICIINRDPFVLSDLSPVWFCCFLLDLVQQERAFPPFWNCSTDTAEWGKTESSRRQCYTRRKKRKNSFGLKKSKKENYCRFSDNFIL